MIYVYALTDPLDAPPDGEPGFAGAPLETVAQDGVGAVFSACTAVPAPDPDNLWRHEAVAEAVMSRAAVLPTRFATTLPDVSRLRALLCRNHPAIRPALDHVRGCLEVGVRVLGEPTEPGAGADGSAASGRAPTPGSTAAAGAGREYLLRRLAEERRRQAFAQPVEAVVEDVHEPLARLARDAVHRPARGRGVLAGAYLVERACLDRFVAAVRKLDREHARRQVLCTGPWPPYSFVPMLELEGSPSA